MHFATDNELLPVAMRKGRRESEITFYVREFQKRCTGDTGWQIFRDRLMDVGFEVTVGPETLCITKWMPDGIIVAGGRTVKPSYATATIEDARYGEQVNVRIPGVGNLDNESCFVTRIPCGGEQMRPVAIATNLFGHSRRGADMKWRVYYKEIIPKIVNEIYETARGRSRKNLNSSSRNGEKIRGGRCMWSAAN